MQIEQDKAADVMYIRIGGVDIADSIEIAEGVIADYNDIGEVIGIEVIAFSQRELDLNQLVGLDSEELVVQISKALSSRDTS